MLTFRPRLDFLVVKPQERIKSDTLIVISDEGFVQGEVIAVGPGREIKGKRFLLDAKPGDIVRFKHNDDYPVITEDGENYVLINEKDIEFVMEEA